MNEIKEYTEKYLKTLNILMSLVMNIGMLEK